MNKKKNGSDQIVLAAIETIEEVDFLLMTELTAFKLNIPLSMVYKKDAIKQ
ncbi:hypothetical protein HGO21_04930 [Acinetobacter sp. CUI P1]|nr:hypothetical protein [Acinetobacter sp. CUI P1]